MNLSFFVPYIYIAIAVIFFLIGLDALKKEHQDIDQPYGLFICIIFGAAWAPIVLFITAKELFLLVQSRK